METRARAGATAAAAVLAVLLLTVLAAWAASIGPSELFRDDGIRPQRDFSTPAASSPPTADESAAEPAPPPLADRDWAWLRVVAVVLELGLAALAGYLLFRGGRWVSQLWGARRRRDPPPEEVAFDVLEDPRALAAEIVRDADRQRALLGAGSPRNGIVGCWHEFEVSASRAGLARKPWQTAAEFTMAVLDLVDADDQAVARLADRYREARFSEHEVTEAHRAEALAALDRIHAGLRTQAMVAR